MSILANMFQMGWFNHQLPLPETNIAPENGVSQKENASPNHQFSGANR